MGLYVFVDCAPVKHLDPGGLVKVTIGIEGAQEDYATALVKLVFDEVPCCCEDLYAKQWIGGYHTREFSDKKKITTYVYEWLETDMLPATKRSANERPNDPLYDSVREFYRLLEERQPEYLRKNFPMWPDLNEGNNYYPKDPMDPGNNWECEDYPNGTSKLTLHDYSGLSAKPKDEGEMHRVHYNFSTVLECNDTDIFEYRWMLRVEKAFEGKTKAVAAEGPWIRAR